MKKTLFIWAVLCPCMLFAQPRIKEKKYPSLLWEISGNGLSRPSYLFGTMHVSNKMAFQLADSFYLGIRSADVVALETNPESWQEDMSRYRSGDRDDTYPGMGYGASSYLSMPNDFLNVNTLRFFKYERKIERSLFSNPSMINNLLYRSYGNNAADFEEDTYLDMYIYQCGKKWGKKVAGVERYGESMKLMSEAYKDAAKDKSRKVRIYDREEDYSTDKLQEAYRSGNLDLLDTINKYNSFSAAFDEKFLYRRNEIQANSIDSILRTRLSLFVGVGAAHLPGNRGVIELLRRMGYRLRPIRMGARDNQQKNAVEKIRVPVVFTTQAADDGFFKVEIPGKFYKFGDDFMLDQRQYADMANGAYYMVTRIMTNGWLWGHKADDVYKKVDSLLYENVPGKITSRTPITKNGYRGFAITNKTRRGDVQRYQIFVTPFEVIFFKMSGTGDYVLKGPEADRFFNSIQLREYKPGSENWKKYSPAYGGFAVEFPHEPFTVNESSRIYDAEDRTTNTQYRVIRTDIHNYQFAEEDTFDLGLMQESFASSEFIDTLLGRKQTVYRGYPALDCKFRDKNKSVFLTRFLIRGPHYYTLIAHGKQEIPQMQAFLNSFEIKPYQYGEARERRDTSLYFTVKSPVFPDEKDEKMDLPGTNYLRFNNDDESEEDILAGGTFRNKVIENDTTGEKIYVSFYKSQRYYQADSTIFDEDRNTGLFGDTTVIVRMKKKYELPGKMKVWERIITDTGSSRAIWTKTFYRDGIGFNLTTEIDTLSGVSPFLQSFYETFMPVDTLKGLDPFSRKSSIFFEDLMSKDSIAHKRAVKNIYLVKLDSTDFPRLKDAINSLNWSEKKYLDTKKSMIGKLSEVRNRKASDYLKDLYYAAGDTVELQYAVLESLLKQQTAYSFGVFRDILTTEPPVLNVSSSRGYDYERYGAYSNGEFMDNLDDSLALTVTIFPDLLPLINLDDYEQPMMNLLQELVDSNLVKPTVYQPYFSKFLIEARQELKKQSITEKNKAIKKAENDKDTDKDDDDSDNNDDGNDDLEQYATLLLPYAESQPAVKPLLQQMLASGDRKLKYAIFKLLLRNNKPVPDTMASYFAASDDYRYTLYSDLKEMGKEDRFPAAYNNHLDLGRSRLLEESSYNKPDSIVFLERFAATIKGQKGFVYFYKYKAKKGDPNWKMASVGLVPEDPKRFEFVEASDDDDDEDSGYYSYSEDSPASKFDLTVLGSTKIKEDEPVHAQLEKALRKLLYSKRKSARQFYQRETAGEIIYETKVDAGD